MVQADPTLAGCCNCSPDPDDYLPSGYKGAVMNAEVEYNKALRAWGEAVGESCDRIEKQMANLRAKIEAKGDDDD